MTVPFGAYYRTYGGTSPGFTMSFTGPAGDGISPQSGTREWYSGQGNMLQRTLVKSLSGVLPGSTLSFWTWYDVEADWDYGYVEASANGTPWTKLVQTSALPAGATDINGSTAWDGGGGLTGNSGGWKQATFALTGFSGNVQIRFRYATDESTNGLGWYADDLKVGTDIADNLDSATYDASWSPDGWAYTDGLQANDWSADIIAPYAKAQKSSYSLLPVTLSLNPSTDTIAGTRYVDAQFLKNGLVYGIVSNRPTGSFSSTGRLTILKGN